MEMNVLATSYEIETFSQSSFYDYKENHKMDNRKLKVYFSIPQNGINSDTGIMLLISGFGGKAVSSVYKKMRYEFSDEYNLVTIQCNYFGYEFMQMPEKTYVPDINEKEIKNILSYDEVTKAYKNGAFNFNSFLDVAKNHKININVKADLSGESISNFNDMGLLQAIDNITCVLSVMNILYDNDLDFNSKKVIIYGHSHGAYLAYLCNALAPTLFSLIIDNSAWLKPVYLSDDICRTVTQKIGKLTLTTFFDYLAKRIIKDTEILSLSYLYSKFENKCNIISYHGANDNLISCREKSYFCNGIDNCIYNEISEEKIDNIVFKSTNHGLSADFLKLFDFTMENFNIEFEKDNRIDLLNEVSFITHKHKYIVDYNNVLPRIYIVDVK